MQTNRQYILGMIFAALLIFYGGDWLLRVAVRGPKERAEKRTEQLEEQIGRKKAELKEIRAEQKQLAIWERQSLPADAGLARSLYQAWVVELVKHVGLAKANVDSSEPVNSKDLYERLSCTARGQGTLEQVTQLLFEFYRAGHLQQVRSLELTPAQQGRQFNVTLIVEALALPHIKRRDALGTAEAHQLAFDKLADYQVIARRNVFGAGGDPDVLAYTRLTAITDVQGRSQAWFSVDISGETLQKSVGEVLEIGPFRGAIVKIEEPDVVLEIDGQRWLITVGETLSQASALPSKF
jgi:hypothetical protein